MNPMFYPIFFRVAQDIQMEMWKQQMRMAIAIWCPWMYFLPPPRARSE
jgi:hypothetical protein